MKHIAKLEGKGKQPIRIHCGTLKFRMMVPGEPQEVPPGVAEFLKKNNSNVTIETGQTEEIEDANTDKTDKVILMWNS